MTVADPNYGTRLYALDQNTGQVTWGPIELGGTYWWSASAFDAGRLFVVNYSGVLRAFDPLRGTQIWSTQLPGQTTFTSPPTALQGVVYTSGTGLDGTVYAVSESAGSWLVPGPQRDSVKATETTRVVERSLRFILRGPL